MALRTQSRSNTHELNMYFYSINGCPYNFPDNSSRYPYILMSAPDPITFRDQYTETTYRYGPLRVFKVSRNGVTTQNVEFFIKQPVMPAMVESCCRITSYFEEKQIIDEMNDA